MNICVLLQIHMNVQDGLGKTLRDSDCDFSIVIRADSVEEAITIFNDLKTTGKKLIYEDITHDNSKSEA